MVQNAVHHPLDLQGPQSVLFHQLCGVLLLFELLHSFEFQVAATHSQLSQNEAGKHRGAGLTFFEPAGVRLEKHPPDGQDEDCSNGGLNRPLRIRSTSLSVSKPGMKEARTAMLNDSVPVSKVFG